MTQQNTEQAEKNFKKGLKASDEGDSVTAKKEYTNAIKLNPSHIKAYNNRGNIYTRESNFNAAIEDYTKAIKACKKNGKKDDIYFNRGFAYINIGKYNMAIADFTKAIEENPTLAVAYINRGLAYSNKREHNKVIENYIKAVELDSKYKINLVEAYKKQGFSYMKNEKYDDAIDEYSKAIELQPNDSGTYFNRGIAYMAIFDDENAINDFNSSIELKPKNANAYYNRGWIYDRSGDNGNIQKAIADYSKSLEINPYFIYAYNNRGLLYSEIAEKSNNKKYYDRAIDDYNTVIEFNEKNPDAYNNRGHIFRLKEDYDNAIKDFKISIEQNQNNEQAYNNLGSTYNDRGNTNNNEEDFDKAIINFTKAIEIKSDYAVAFNNMGGAYACKYAIYLNKITQCQICNTPYLNYEKIAIINYDKAITSFTEAIRLKPDYVNAYNNRGNIFNIKGEDKKAQKDFTKAKRLPQNRIDSSTTKGKSNTIRDFASTIKDLQDSCEIRSQLLYKYKTINKNILSALVNDSIWVANPKTFNDPLDGSYLYDKIQSTHFIKDLENIGIISFESNEAKKGGINTLMWSHYADSHKGICLIYKRVDRQGNKQVNYKNNRILKVKYKEDIALQQGSTTEHMIEIGFRTKHSSWGYENEYRLILHQEKLNKGKLYTTKELRLSLVGVIFGLKCNDEDLIKKILEHQDIKYYKIEQNTKHRVVKHLQLVKRKV